MSTSSPTVRSHTALAQHPFLVTGCARSATGYTAQLFSNLGNINPGSFFGDDG